MWLCRTNLFYYNSMVKAGKGNLNEFVDGEAEKDADFEKMKTSKK